MKTLVQSVARNVIPRSMRTAMPIGWQAILCRVTGDPPRFSPPPADGKVRLNLGSGGMPLPGYLNVDQAPEREGSKPDIVSDVLELKLPDCYADEIMAVHLFEHIYLWDVDRALREWHRVLKPSGRLVVELPDLVKSARNFLRNPDIFDAETMKLSMHGFYGDPQFRDTAMIHKWGWTPRALARKLRDCGFVNVREQLPMFHQMRRDFRLCAEKPTVQLECAAG